jgi:hypothetical protein
VKSKLCMNIRAHDANCLGANVNNINLHWRIVHVVGYYKIVY